MKVEKKKAFVVSENMGGFIQSAIPKDYEVHICKNKDDAYNEYLVHMEQNEKHLVILDNREENDLLDVAEELVNHYKKARIIFMFSPLHEETTLEVVRLGVRHIIAKPFYPGHLTKMIEEIMND